MSNRHVYVQVIESHPHGDVVKASASSQDLSGLGWKAGTRNLPSAYLTGILAGRRALGEGVKEAIVDSGLRSSTKGSRLYAAVNGLVDAGLEVPHAEDVLPSKERLSGGHIAAFGKLLSSRPGDSYKRLFSAYLRKSLKPEDLAGHFEQVKEQVQSGKVEARN